jgi:hypothetical protein
MNRYLKKTFAAAVLAPVGFVTGVLIAAPVLEGTIRNSDMACIELLTKASPALATRTEQEQRAYLDSIKNAPCWGDLKELGAKIVAIPLTGAALGVTAGFVLVGRRKKDAPTPL